MDVFSPTLQPDYVVVSFDCAFDHGHPVTDADRFELRSDIEDWAIENDLNFDVEPTQRDGEGHVIAFVMRFYSALDFIRFKMFWL